MPPITVCNSKTTERKLPGNAIAVELLRYVTNDADSKRRRGGKKEKDRRGARAEKCNDDDDNDDDEEKEYAMSVTVVL